MKSNLVVWALACHPAHLRRVFETAGCGQSRLAEMRADSGASSRRQKAKDAGWESRYVDPNAASRAAKP